MLMLTGLLSVKVLTIRQADIRPDRQIDIQTVRHNSAT